MKNNIQLLQVVASLVDVPEEVCDLNPEKICRYKTTLVPSLVPQEECTQVPKESCHLSFSSPKPEKKPLLTKWCLDQDLPEIRDNSLETGEISEDGNLDSHNSAVFDLRAAEGQESKDVVGLLDTVTQELAGQEEQQPTYGNGNVDLSESVYSLPGETVGQFYGAPREARGTGRRQNLKKHSGYRDGNNSSLKSIKQQQFPRFPKQERSFQQPQGKRSQAGSGSGGRKRQQKQSNTRKTRKASEQGKSRMITQLRHSSRRAEQNRRSH